MKTILVGYSGSEQAERALARAAELAEALAATLVVVSVSKAHVIVPASVLDPDAVFVPSPVGGPMPTGETIPLPEGQQPIEPEELARRELDRARRALAGRRVEAEYVAEVGAPAERLLEVAEERDADLIVVGSREHGFLERLVGRSVDETLARRSECDVLLVH